MALNKYVLNGPSVVILADSRDPYISWAHHITRAGRGGVDLVAAVGTPVYAPTAGTWNWRRNNGSAGNSGEFGHDANPGWRDVFSHLSRYVGWSGKHFEQGQIIAYTGTTGGVVQHLHRHLLDPQGRRRNPWDYFTATAATNITPIPTIDYALLRRQKEDTMYVKGTSYKTVYNVYTDANGAARLRVCSAEETDFANVGGLIVNGWDAPLEALGRALGYQFGVDNPTPKVEATISKTELDQAIADAIAKVPSGALTKADLIATLNSITLKAS